MLCPLFRSVARVSAAALLCLPALAQSAPPPPAPPPPPPSRIAGAAAPDGSAPASAAEAGDPAARFQAAEVIPSPQSNFQIFNNAIFHDGRYVAHQATMASLIADAYGVDERNVQGGPPWLEWDKFEITATAPPATKPADQHMMLRALLADRFHLVVHNGTAPMPAWALLADHPKLKASAAAAPSGDSGDNDDGPKGPGPGSSGCVPQPPAPGGVPGSGTLTVNCKHVTMAEFTQTLDWMGNGFLGNLPVNDATGLSGTYDFSVEFTPPFLRRRASGDDAAPLVTIFDAVQRLGLKLERRTAPAPVLVVDSVSETPTPNAPDIETLIPPPPAASFDVAVIKPSAPGGMPRAAIRGNQLDVAGLPLKFFINFAWGLNFNGGDMLANAPAWLDSARYDIVAKNTSAPPTDSGNGGADIDQLRQMLRTLLTDRFEVKTHTESRPEDTYILRADSPRLQKADPASRTKCINDPGPDGKDPRTGNPALDRVIYCQNVTMAQFAEDLSKLAPGYFEFPVVDDSKLASSWDFTLAFSSRRVSLFGAGPAPTPAAGAGGNALPSASDPTGELSLYDAVRKQLGLRLDKEKRPEQVLVLDHIDQQPTPN